MGMVPKATMERVRRLAEEAADQARPSPSLRDIVKTAFEDVEATIKAIKKVHPRNVWAEAAKALEEGFASDGVRITVNPASLKSYYWEALRERRPIMLAQERNQDATEEIGVDRKAAGDREAVAGTGGAGEARDAREEASASHSAEGCPAPLIVPPLKIPGRTDKDRAIASIRERLDPAKLAGGLTPIDD